MASAACCESLRRTAELVFSPAAKIKDYVAGQVKQYELEAPANVVMATAKKPGWLYIDNLVFTLQGALLQDDDMETMEKKGSFFTAKMHDVGTWRMLGNVLYLNFPGCKNPETVICVKTGRSWMNQKTHLAIDVFEPKPANPWWFEPDYISEDFSSAVVCCREFECPVCFFPLHKFRPAIIKKHSRRSCPHYFHHKCAVYLRTVCKHDKEGAVCPVCSATFCDVQQLPDMMKHPREWFQMCDIDLSGTLSQEEAIEALGAVLPVSRNRLTKNVRSHWREWDPDGDGIISMQEFIIPGTGMRDWCVKNMAQLRPLKQEDEGATFQASIPSLDRSPIKWFEYWDKDKSGSFERDELFRALIRTYCVDREGYPNLTSAFDMREAAFIIWKSAGLSPFAKIDFDQFAKPYGLMDQFIHNQMNCMYFGLDEDLSA